MDSMMAVGDPSASTSARMAAQQQQPTLADLLQQSRKLQTQIGARGHELPSIQLGLDQIEAQSRKIAQTRGTGSSGRLDGDAGDLSLYAPGASNDAKAHYFLASGGIDAGGLADTITSSNIALAFEPLQPIYDTDVESYLRHSHEQVILSAIEEGRRETLADFRRNLARAQVRDWELQKVRILEELGQHQPASRMDSSSLRADGASQLGLGAAPSPYRSARSMTPMRYDSGSYGQAGSSAAATSNPRIAKYLGVVERLNASRTDGTPFALASAFASAVQANGAAGPSASGENNAQDLHDAWHALASVIGESDAAEGQFKGIVIRERQYAPAYLATKQGADDAWLGREGKLLRNTLVSGAIGFLERYFSDHIESRIASNPVKAQLGGRPTTVGRVIAFERVAFMDREGRWPSELEVIQTASNGRAPAWATIFYLLCSGNTDAALSFVAEHEDALRSLDAMGGSSGSFLSFFKAWLDSPDRVLPKQMRDRFLAEYNSRFRGSYANDGVDGYKQALFKLIGRIDVNKNFPASVTKDAETWMWLQLSSVRESYSDEAGESLRDRLTLQDLGSRVVKLGDRHFDPKGTRPLQYFMLLLLCGQFERAVAFLYTKPQHQIDAVNFAATLAYYGLLRVPSHAKASHIDVLTTSVDERTGQEVTMLDFAKIIQKYVRLFARSDAKSALQYAYLICLSSDCKSPVGDEQTQRCHELIRGLILSTRQYFDLLGDVRNDGTKTPGLIEKSLSLIRIDDAKAFMSNIVGAAAVQSEAENRTRDAILLYNIAEEYDRVLDVVNRQLGQTLVEVPSSTQDKSGAAQGDASLASVEDPSQLARAILESYERQSHILRHVTPAKRETCRILLTLKDCFALFSRGELEKTLNTIDSLALIPLRGDVVSITRKAEAFKDIDDSIARNLSEILLLVMNCISKLYQALKASPYGDASRQQRLGDYRGQARALMLFAGMLRLRVEPSTFGQLTRLDVYLH